MAGENVAVEVEPEDVVVVDVTDEPELQLEAEPPKPAAPPKPVTERRTRQPAAADEATNALNAAVKAAEDARKAAEDTALAERRRADEAGRLAAQREAEAKTYREQAENHELVIINNGIESATRDVSNAQAELEHAMEAGEFGKASAAQVKLSKAAAALDRMEAAKADYEAGTRKGAPIEAAPPQPQQLSAFEQYVSGYPPAAQAWLRAHPDCVPPYVTDREGRQIALGGDPVKNAKTMQGHYAAKARNIAEGSKEYFEVIEEHIGARAPTSAAAETTQAEAPRAAPRQRQAQPSAPVSRDAPGPNGAPRSTRSVQLTRDQQEMAKVSWPHLPVQQAFANYARNLLELEAEGKMGRVGH